MASTIEVLTLAQANFLQNPPLFFIFQNSAQTFTTSVFAATTFDGSVQDTYAGHSTVTNNSRYTPQVAGTYMIGGATGWASNATGGRGGGIYKNGSPLTTLGGGNAIVGNAGGGGTVTISPIPPIPVQLTLTDYVEIWGFQNSGGNLATNAGGQFCSYMYGWLEHL